MIIFVCTGNTCRSPMACALLKNKLKSQGHKIDVKSFGILVVDDSASKGAINAMKSIGININAHIPALISEDAVSNALLVLTMTNSHKVYINNTFGENDKVYTLYEYVHGINKDVQDPYSGPSSLYLQTAKELSKLIDELRLPII